MPRLNPPPPRNTLGSSFLSPAVISTPPPPYFQTSDQAGVRVRQCGEREQEKRRERWEGGRVSMFFLAARYLYEVRMEL